MMLAKVCVLLLVAMGTEVVDMANPEADTSTLMQTRVRLGNDFAAQVVAEHAEEDEEVMLAHDLHDGTTVPEVLYDGTAVPEDREPAIFDLADLLVENTERSARKLMAGQEGNEGEEERVMSSVLSIAEEGVGQVTCVAEEQLKKAWRYFFDSRFGKHMAPSYIRIAFHDAIDEKNLLLHNFSTGKWEHVPGNYGGMDGCLYSPLSGGTTGKPERVHNWHLEDKLAVAVKLAEKAHGRRRRPQLCAPLKNCIVDMVALGAITALEIAGGPSIPMKWGRKKGNCTSMIQTNYCHGNHGCRAAEKKSGSLTHPALRDAPSLLDMDNATHFREVFQQHGFDAAEQAELMGAHSFGKVQPTQCVGASPGFC